MMVRFGANDTEKGRWEKYPKPEPRESYRKARTTAATPPPSTKLRFTTSVRVKVPRNKRNQCRGDSAYSLKLSADAEREKARAVKKARALAASAMKPIAKGRRKAVDVSLDWAVPLAETMVRENRKTFVVPSNPFGVGP